MISNHYASRAKLFITLGEIFASFSPVVGLAGARKETNEWVRAAPDGGPSLSTSVAEDDGDSTEARVQRIATDFKSHSKKLHKSAAKLLKSLVRVTLRAGAEARER
jgi:hypothetical protein